MAPKYYDSRPVVHHHVILKPHHKKIIVGGSSLVVLFMIVMSIFMYMSFTKQELNYKILDKKISDLKAETNSNVNSLTDSIIETRNDLSQDLSEVGSQIENINEDFSLLKASAGADFSDIIEDSIPSVVTIRTDISQGTGFIIHEKGFIITNAHVIQNAEVITAINSNQQKIAAELVGYNLSLDLALLKIPGDYQKLTFADSNEIQVGGKVIAVGNPLGLQFSVSQGIISALHRKSSNSPGEYVQTDAALNPGNSGGPLIDTNGKVVGINNFKVGNSESLGFALESNYIIKSINEIAQEKMSLDLI